MICPYCQSVNDDGADRCASCLKHLPHVDVMPSQSIGAQSVSLLEPSSPYKPNGPFDIGATLRLLAAGIAAAIVVAGIYFAVTRLVDLLIIFPAIAGAIVGAVMGNRIQKEKLRNIPAVVVCSLIAGFLTSGLKVTFDAYALRPDLVAFFTQEIRDQTGSSEAAAKSEADRYLTPYRTVRMFLVVEATEGVSVGHVGTKGTPLKGGAFWALTALEALCVIAAAMSLAIGEASTPFCEACQTYRKTANVFKKHPQQAEQLVDLTRHQQWESARDLPIDPPTDDKNMAWLALSACPNCGTGQVFVTSKAKGKTKTLFNADVPASSVAALRAAEESETPSPSVAA